MGFVVEPAAAEGSATDVLSFLTAYRQGAGQIRAYISSILPNQADADDVFQETSLLLWQKFDQFQPGTDFVAWGCRIARFRVLKLQARGLRSRITFRPEVLETLADEISSMSSELGNRERALQECLQALPQRQVDLLRRRYAVGSDPQQIARATQRSVHAVYKALNRLHAALIECVEKKLRRQLDE